MPNCDGVAASVSWMTAEMAWAAIGMTAARVAAAAEG